MEKAPLLPNPDKADRYGVPWYHGEREDPEEQRIREDSILNMWRELGGPTVEELLDMIDLPAPLPSVAALSVAEAAEREGISRATFDRHWLPVLRDMTPPMAWKSGAVWKVLPRGLDLAREEFASPTPSDPSSARRPKRRRSSAPSSGKWEL